MQVMQLYWWCRATRILVKFTIFVKCWRFQRKKKGLTRIFLSNWTFHSSLGGNYLWDKWKFTVLRRVHSSYPPSTTIVCYTAIPHACQNIRMAAASITSGIPTCTETKEIQYWTKSDKLASATLCSSCTLHRLVWQNFWGKGTRGIIPAASYGKALFVSGPCASVVNSCHLQNGIISGRGALSRAKQKEELGSLS